MLLLSFDEATLYVILAGMVWFLFFEVENDNIFRVVSGISRIWSRGGGGAVKSASYKRRKQVKKTN